MRIGAKWVSPPFNADGWRLDVAADLGHSPEFNHKFWKEFRRVVKEANPEAIILAEHYGDAMSWLQGDEWDTVMNYDAFMEPVSIGEKRYLVNTSGTIQKATSSSSSASRPELGKGFKDIKDSNDTAWTVDTSGIIQ